MSVTVEIATESDRTLLDRLMQLYLYDFSEFDGRELDDEGRYEYIWLDAYWTDDDRRAYLIRSDGRPVGFALVRLTDPVEMAEFFVMRPFRSHGIGRRAAQQILALHVGDWRISEVKGNDAAVGFWRVVIPVAFSEHMLADGTREQRFRVALP
ncbi:GNAT family N-acetyltransferase [Humibacter ginsenosidimutans]|uniref:GNAT family N-acetyltransferase n=1 Tax=Humibacter ginsenosidimutans TaxID=2599293 RepID=UPI00143CCDA7|nr:GNAT family N-acetyltransferase [Humibacter ginsenosidimutans]